MCENPAWTRAKLARGRAEFTCVLSRPLCCLAGFGVSNPRDFRYGAQESCEIVRESFLESRKIGVRACGIHVRMCENPARKRAKLACGRAEFMCILSRLLCCLAGFGVSNPRDFRYDAMESCAIVRESCAEERKIGVRVCEVHARLRESPAWRSANLECERSEFTCVCARHLCCCVGIGVSNCRKFRSGALEYCAIVRDSCASVRESCAIVRESCAVARKLGVRFCEIHVRLRENPARKRAKLARECSEFMCVCARLMCCWVGIGVSNSR